jgi:hypothetical protein
MSYTPSFLPRVRTYLINVLKVSGEGRPSGSRARNIEVMPDRRLARRKADRVADPPAVARGCEGRDHARVRRAAVQHGSGRQ